MDGLFLQEFRRTPVAQTLSMYHYHIVCVPGMQAHHLCKEHNEGEEMMRGVHKC